MLLFDLTVVLAVFVKVVSQKFSHDNQVFFMVEVVNDFKQVLFVQVFAIVNNKSKQFDFINTLVKVVLVVFNDLQTNHLFCVNIVALNCFRKCCRTKIFNNLISSCNDWVNDDWEFFCFFKSCFLSVKDYLQVITVVNNLVKLSRVEAITWHGELNILGQHTCCSIFWLIFTFLGFILL